MLAYRRTVLAVVSTATLGVSSLLAAPAFADDPSLPGVPNPPSCTNPLPLRGSEVPICVTVNNPPDNEGGVKARVRVGDVLCVKVDALTERKTADARVILPCPIHYVPVPVPVEVTPEPAPVETPEPAPVAQAPEIVQAHLPVTN